MADDGNEDSWLYGATREEDGAEASSGEAGSDDAKKSSDDTTTGAAKADGTGEDNADGRAAGEAANAKTTAANGEDAMDTGEPEEVVPNPADEMEEADREDGERLSGEDGENSESEEDDDDINVVIGDIKSGPNYNIKQRSGAAAAGATPAADKAAKQAPGGKFSMEEFESVGTINGTPSHEFSIDSLEEKPWRKPGADITDYFNYGFNEDTWRMYCERQKRMRQNESGVGLQGLMVAPVMVAHNQVDRSTGPGGRTLTPIANDNSKYGALTTMPMNRRAGPPPGRRMTGAIDVIGGNGVPMGGKQENAIQVMTAERREYSRPGMPPGGKFDMPPPVFPPVGPGGPPGSGGGGPGGVGPPGRNMGPGPESSGPIIDAFQDEFSYGYEPTQDSQWGAGHGNPGWAPTGIKELTPMMPQMVPAPGMGGMPPDMSGMPPGMQGVPPPQRYPPDRGGPSDRDRSMRGERSERERERDRERDRERSDRGGGGGGEKDRRAERDSSSRRRDRSRSRERSRRRSRSKEKAPASTSASSSGSSRHRERSSRSEKRDKDTKEKDKDRKRDDTEE